MAIVADVSVRHVVPSSEAKAVIVLPLRVSRSHSGAVPGCRAAFALVPLVLPRYCIATFFFRLQPDEE
jgi:hypothetical protein